MPGYAAQSSAYLSHTVTWAFRTMRWSPTRACRTTRTGDRPLDEILELRADRMRIVHHVIATLTDDVLGGQTDPVPPPGYPPAGSYPVRRCLGAILSEEWLHRQYAERDLAALEQRG